MRGGVSSAVLGAGLTLLSVAGLGVAFLAGASGAPPGEPPPPLPSPTPPPSRAALPSPGLVTETRTVTGSVATVDGGTATVRETEYGTVTETAVESVTETVLETVSVPVAPAPPVTVTTTTTVFVPGWP